MVMLFLPRDARSCEPNLTAYCHWCVETRPKKDLFKVRDGPTDWHFCDVIHAELWLEYRHKKETYKLCRMGPKERLEYLDGKSMHDEISRLFPEKCAPSQS